MPAGSVKTLDATQLRTVIFVPHVTDIATQEITFGGRHVLEEGYEQNIPSVSRAHLEWI